MDTWIRERFEHANRIVNRLPHPDIHPATTWHMRVNAILHLQEIFVSQWLRTLEPRFVQEWKRVENEGGKMDYEWLELHDELIETIWSRV